MSVINYMKDSLVNFVSGLGTSRDKAASGRYAAQTGMSNAELLAFYRSSWLAKKTVQIPAFDSFRKWRNWQAVPDEITLIEAEEKRLHLRQKLYEARWKARLFGWCAIYISDGTSDPKLPLDPTKLRKGGIKFLNVMPKWHFKHDNLQIDRDPQSETFGHPIYYVTAENSTANGILLPQIEIHPSRLVIFKGDPTPDDGELGSLSVDGFMLGESVLEGRFTAIRNADSAAANIASLIYEAKTDVISIPDLMENLRANDYAERLMSRFSLAATAKGINGVLLLDAQETYDQKNVALTGLDSLLDRFLQMVAGASDIPVTRLLGVSPGGLNATGEHDLRNYYDFVQALQENEISPALLRLDECLIWSALGNRPQEVHYVWASLWQISDKERAEIGRTGATIIKELNDTGLYPPEALASAGANYMVENAVLPGFTDMIEEAGGLPDYDFGETAGGANEAPAERKQQVFDATPKSLYVCRYVKNSAAIAAHYRRQGITVKDVENMHVTILYSKAEIDWFSVGDAWQGELKFDGGARDHDLFGAQGATKHLVLMIKCRELEWRHEEFISKGASHDFEDFQPHITLQSGLPVDFDMSGIEPYRGEIVLGAEMFEEVKND